MGLVYKPQCIRLSSSDTRRLVQILLINITIIHARINFFFLIVGELDCIIHHFRSIGTQYLWLVY